ncbi:hypothetical protein [Stenotrophomonas maltophilia]|uniref:hypothetical protein n=1 Tax=Stenotrophomonas maltophilia TaxID=40324 RepID=UPI001660A7B7|nr:hypothetical protein [Stenotrophomonas maltophilia]MBN4958896.1 hypothetical protein [Stenotrophomonas maltophilia]MBN4965109.1 hypothetical protein [Stenotrophomonas maltophilia]
MISRKLLCSAVLACITPLAASAAEAYLTPNTNGGSGDLPSGYSKVYFELSNDDWISEIKLPSNPRDGDAVELSSLASAGSRLHAAATSFSDAAYLPVEQLSNIELAWNGDLKRWDVKGGLSARKLEGGNVPAYQIPDSDHLLTQMVFTNGRHVGRISLPDSAVLGAVLTVSNRATWGTTVTGPQMAGGEEHYCADSIDCTFVFNADGKWHARRGREHFQPTQPQLPVPAQRWTDIVISGPADDVVTPWRMTLPTSGIHGDIIQFTDVSNSRFYGVVNGGYIGGAGMTFRYDARLGAWVKQPR